MTLRVERTKDRDGSYQNSEDWSGAPGSKTSDTEQEALLGRCWDLQT